VMGIAESFANLIIESLSVIIDPLLALGLWRVRPWARWLAIAWYALLAVISVRVAHLLLYYHPEIQLRTWPNLLAGKAMPFFLIVVMFLPRVKQVFARHKKGTAPDVETSTYQAGPEATGRWSIVSLISLLFLIVVVSNLAVGAADWIERSVAEWNQTEAS
jgi:hypothetical protein